MISAGTDNLLNKFAKLVSIIFHPLWMPLYGLILIFTAPTLLGFVPFTVKKFLFIIVGINNVLIPLSLLPYLKYRKIISSYNMNERKERLIPLSVVSVLYIFTSYIISGLQVPIFFKSFIFATTCLAIIVTAVTFWWKISVHSVATGAITGLVIALSFKMYAPLVWQIVAVVITGGIILSSRLKLNSHNPAQIWLGFLTGFVGSGAFLYAF
ncbi:MAG: hypothetical protein HPY62_02495 [Bacteroidales bacterium]|nr:hypothetical protein [Bacteroidales bacterium]